METKERLLSVGIAVLLVAGGISGYIIFNRPFSGKTPKRTPKRLEYTISRLSPPPCEDIREDEGISTWTTNDSIKFELNFTSYMIPEE